VIYYRFDYDDLFEITSDGSAIVYLGFHHSYYSVHRTEIDTGATSVVAEGVIMYRYVQAAGQLVVVRGRNSGRAEVGDGLYLVP